MVPGHRSRRVVRSRQSYLRIAALSQALRAVVGKGPTTSSIYVHARDGRGWVGWLVETCASYFPVCFLI